MSFKKRFLAGLAAACAVGLASFAVAQVITVPQVQSIGQTDLVQVIPLGQPSAQNIYATPGAVAGVLQYAQQTPLTGFAITVPARTSLMFITPAGTLATGAFTMEPTPSDGQSVCLISSQTQTAVTVAGNTGQTIGGFAALTAMVANTRYCYFFNRATATWYRSQQG